ncbi:MAG: response regulator [Methanobacteriota archaeon]
MVGNYQILFIDDEIELLDIGRMFLERSGEFIVTTISDSEGALNLLKEKKFDVIVSDYDMPKLTGIELLSILKENNDTTPFIIFTGKGREEVVIEALNNGADFYIQKTGDPKSEFAELASKIRYAVSRRYAEKELEKVLTNLKLSQQVAHIGNWTLDLNNSVYTASTEGLSIFGYPPDYQPTYQEITEAIHPDDRMIARDTLSCLLETGTPYNIDIRIFRQDTGEMRYIQSQGQLVQSEKYGHFSVFGTNLDITDRKKIEETLRETNSYLENLITIATVPIIIWDPTYQITRINQACEVLFGHPAEYVIGKTLETLFPPGKVDQSMSLIKAISNEGRGVIKEIDILHKDGTIRTVLWNSATLFGSDGKQPIATIAQGQDVTLQRRLERERDAAEVQIQQNLAQLAVLNDGIRNPLMVISGYAEIFGDRSIANKILQQIQLIDEMVNQVDRRWAESEMILRFLRKHLELKEELSDEGLGFPPGE